MSFRDAILDYLHTGLETDLHEASFAVGQLLNQEDGGGVLEAMTTVHAEVEKSLCDERGRRAFELAMTLNTLAWMLALAAPPLTRRLGTEMEERKALEEDVRAAILTLTREREFLEARVSERTFDLMAAKADLQTIVFLASHDLRTPANAIELSARVLEEDLAETGSEQARSMVAEISAGARRILNRLRAFVELNRIEDYHEDKIAVDLAELVDTVWRAIKPPLHVELRPEITLEKAYLEAGMIRAIVDELIDNALAHAGPSLSVIAVRVRWDQGLLMLEVADDGQGVPEEARERILRPFETLDRAPDREGNGIGLALVDKLLQLRGGAIRCEADPDLGGACFKLVIR